MKWRIVLISPALRCKQFLRAPNQDLSMAFSTAPFRSHSFRRRLAVKKSASAKEARSSFLLSISTPEGRKGPARDPKRARAYASFLVRP